MNARISPISRPASGQGERERGAFTRPALHPHPSAVGFDDLPADVEPEPGSTDPTLDRRGKTGESPEQQLDLLRSDPFAAITHREQDLPIERIDPQLDRRVRLGVLLRVREQV